MRKRNALPFNDTIYCADFETSVATESDMNIVYLGVITAIEFTHALRSDDSFSSIRTRAITRYPQDMGKVLYDIFLESARDGVTTIVYFHNLPFDASFITNFIELNKHIQVSKTFTSGSNPWMISYGIDENVFLQLRCSFKLLNRSVGVIGDMIGHAKQELDYSVFRGPESELTAAEIDYCINDCKVVLCGIIDECKNWEWIRSVADIPLTFTGFSRRNNKESLSRHDNAAWSYYCRDTFPDDFHTYALMREAYLGGYTHANSFFRSRRMDNVHSFDVISDYPSQSIQMAFPATRGRRLDTEEIRQSWPMLEASCRNIAASGVMQQIGTRSVLGNVMFYGRFIFHNVSVKNDGEKYMPLLSGSKIKTLSSAVNDIKFTNRTFGEITAQHNRILDNGRVISWDTLQLAATEVDVVNYLMCYDIERIDCVELYLTRTKNSGGICQLVNRNILYANMKTDLKTIAKTGIQPPSSAIPRAWWDDIWSDSELARVKACRYLRLSKSLLNAQYGIDATKLSFQDTTWEDGIFNNTDMSDEELFARDFPNGTPDHVKSSYLVGVYITAYARRHLVLVTRLIHEIGYTVLYWDTDSVKVWREGETEDDRKRLFDAINMFNAGVRVRCNSSPYPEVTENPWKFGEFDYEGTYSHFSALNSKRYIYIENDELFVKASGLVQATEKIRVIYDYLAARTSMPFDILIKLLWKTNTLFDQSFTGRTYLDRTNQGKWCDEYNQFAGAIIRNTDYAFVTYRVEDESVWMNYEAERVHYDLVSKYIFKNECPTEWTYVYCKDGYIVIKYKTKFMFIPCDTSKFKHGILLTDCKEDICEL